jgi:hypothetical protein
MDEGKSKTVGVLEKKANVTLIGGEVVIGKEARGNVKARSYSMWLYSFFDSFFPSSTCWSPTHTDPMIQRRQKVMTEKDRQRFHQSPLR